MSNPLVTVIIPVYNAEKYIKRCLDSIMSQTYNNVEIICIDDGSKDNSYSILRDYELKFPSKIYTFTQSNVGVATTRNRGIQRAKGKYIFFIDNDDYIAKDYIQKHVEAAEMTNDDMIISGYKRVDENQKCIFYDKTKGNPVWEPFKRFAPWGRIYRKDFIVNNNLLFLNNIIGEDDFFNIIAATKTNKISVLDYTGYFWTFNSKSISNTQHIDPQLEQSAVYLLNQIFQNIDPSYLASNKNILIEYAFVKFAVWFILFYGRKLKYTRLKSAYINLFSIIKKYFPKYQKNELIGLFTPRGEHYKTRLIVCFFIFLEKTRLVSLFLKCIAGICEI